MGRSSFIFVLLVSLLLASCFSRGFGRKMVAYHMQGEDFTVTGHAEENAGSSRQMIETVDYPDPEPNTNPNSAYVYSPPSPWPQR